MEKVPKEVLARFIKEQIEFREKVLRDLDKSPGLRNIYGKRLEKELQYWKERLDVHTK